MTDPPSDLGELVARFYGAESAYLAAEPGQGDFAPMASTLHRECVMIQPDSLPYSGEWRGHAGYQAWMEAFARTWRSLAVTDSRLYQADPITVFSRSTVVATARINSRRISYPLLQMIAIRDGQIQRVEPFYWDTHQVLAALGEDPDTTGS